jgi:hypothetical protein
LAELSYSNFFNVYTHRSEFNQQVSITVEEDASHHYVHSSLHLEFVLALTLQSTFSTPNFHYFGSLNYALRGRRFPDADELKTKVYEELRRFNEVFCTTGTERLKQS